jgi:Ca-activated chloride channel homolog
MNFNDELTAVEYTFIGVFVILYALYVARTVWVARQIGTTARAIVIKFFLRTIYFVLMIAALLGPFFGEPERNIIAEGKDIMVLVDLSKSMDAIDIQPSRLEKVKFELQRLTKALPNERFGMIVFSSQAFLQVPLTFDLAAFELFVQALSTDQITNGGTDICSALQLSEQKLFQERRNTSKIILLFTDGEDFGNCEGKILSTIRQFDLKLFIVGTGTTTGGQIPTTARQMLKDNEGNTVISRLNANFLRELAMATNGQYFEINNRVNTMSEVIGAIGVVENKLIDSRQTATTSNKYRYFLMLALVLIALDVLITITTFQL